MKNFFAKIAQFMQGRYGNDSLNNTLLILAAAVWVINLFARSIVLILITLLILVLAIFRALSTNITKRLYENRRFKEITAAAGDFFKRQYMKIRDFRTHRYVRCPYCKANLRLKKRTGVQHIHCPRCQKDFKKNILF